MATARPMHRTRPEESVVSTATATIRVSRARPALLPIVAPITAAALAALFFGLHAGATPDESWRLAARYTARLSFCVFLLTYVASSWQRRWPGDFARQLVRQRRGLGLAFAAAHSVHLGALVQYNLVTEQVPDAVTLIGGGGAYVAMFAMAATSNDASVRALGRQWRTLHRIGMHWLWFIFTFSYAGRVVGGDLAFVPMLAAALGGLGLRIAVWRRRRARSA
jgi:DMSO/TMAO reductase YedYZ heme-binding membrane subunit